MRRGRRAPKEGPYARSSLRALPREELWRLITAATGVLRARDVSVPGQGEPAARVSLLPLPSAGGREAAAAPVPHHGLLDQQSFVFPRFAGLLWAVLSVLLLPCRTQCYSPSWSLLQPEPMPAPVRAARKRRKFSCCPSDPHLQPEFFYLCTAALSSCIDFVSCSTFCFLAFSRRSLGCQLPCPCLATASFCLCKWGRRCL